MFKLASNSKLVKMIVTFFGAGLFPIMPGTIGSIAAFPLIFLINYVITTFFFKSGMVLTNISELISLLTYHLFIVILLFLVGTYFTSIYIKHNAFSDPKEVVIDEVVGQYFLIIITTPGALVLSKQFYHIVLIALMLILFRIFDIIKPWPISWFDKNVKGALGVMIDDIIAAIFGSIVFYLIMYVFI